MLKFEAYRSHVAQMIAAALEAVDPASAVSNHLQRSGQHLRIGSSDFDLTSGRVFVISVGKAAVPMAEAASAVLGDALYAAAVISKRGSDSTSRSMLREHPHVHLLQGSHPVSAEDSISATSTAIAILEQTTANDLVLCLISGGASALFTQPIVPLSDWQLLLNALLASGCTINELNTVRRQLDRVKGGGLARLAAPARCATLILSDVIGNPLEAIGSGPTIMLAESPQDAQAILQRYAISARIGAPAAARIDEALRQVGNSSPEMPAAFEIAVVGDVRRAAQAAASAAEALGFSAQILTVHLEGEAREVGRVAAALAKDAPPDACLILGGETTVTIKGDGHGGRNLETALSAAIGLAGRPLVAVASLATDGEDGPTPAAGAVVAGWTVPLAEKMGLTARDFLDRNDSYTFFSRLDALTANNDQIPSCLFLTGSTGTNVNDLLLVLTYGEA